MMQPSKRLAGRIDLTPTWLDVLPVYLDAIEHGSPTSRQAAREELTRLAAFADEVNKGFPK